MRRPHPSGMLLGALLALPLHGQVVGMGSISGIVLDTSEAPVPDARVELANLSLGIRRTAKTSSDGHFSIPALPPDSGYLCTVTKTGFSAFQGRVGVEVGQTADLLIVLEVFVGVTRIPVVESTPVVEATKSGVSQVVHSRQILHLPINGRRADTFVLLTPGVVPDGTQGLVSFRGIAGGNTFLTDGNDTSNQFFHENAGRTRITTQISQDAVQEFGVVATGASAEFGHASGGIINTVTRSGSNAFHGTGYWFFRNRTLNARDPYSAINPPEKRYQIGASAGGRIVRDQLFYFLNVEAPRRTFPLIASLTRPPLFDANGRFITGACQATTEQCALALRFLGRQFQVVDRTANSELLFGKLDWRPDQRNSLSASFNYLRFISPNGFQTQAVLNNGEGIGNNGNSTVRTRYGRLAWTAIPGSAVVNEFRFGWFKDRHFDDLDPRLIPPETGLVQITVQGQSSLGVSADLPRLYPSENRFQWADNFTWMVGNHTAKAGFDLVNTRDFIRSLRNGQGAYSYADFTSFARDFSGNTSQEKRWLMYTQRFGNDTVDTTIRDYAFFVQDQFRVSRGVTLNYGLRYEYAQLEQPPAANPDYTDSGRIPSAKNNLAPRIGVAVALNHSKTVLRGGYGLYYARYHGGLINTFFLENGSYQKALTLERRFLSELTLGPVFPNRLPPSAERGFPPGSGDPNFASTIDLTLPSKDYRNPYTQQADLAVEQALTSNLSLTLSYLWSRGIHLTTVRDLNIGPAGTPFNYRINDSAGNQAGRYTTPTYRLANRVNPRWRRVNSVESGGNSYYNALLVQLRQRLWRGLEASAAYTWAHAIDFNQGGGADNIFFSEGPRSLFNGDYRGDKGSSQLDQRHRLVMTAILAPTFTKRNTRWARYAINNWQLSQIWTFASSQPATATVFVAGVPFPNAAFNTSLNGFGGSTRVPFYPASSLDIDRRARGDARLTKLLRFSERSELHLHLEAFNVFNHVYNTSVNTMAFEARDGVLTPMPRLGEGAASQGYPDGTNARRLQVGLRVVF
ncbi:MAG: TonB-dependent receptor [Acidobacteria bacterium]|nr:TonB-dependent receptor [Acidobacteriota bacterium]